jgi:serine/threonine protein phosphatase PrpC
MELGRSPTFLVGAAQQKRNVDEFHREEQHLSEMYQKNKPLCFNAHTYQKTHPAKASKMRKDADATVVSPMLLGVADGVSQIEDFGIDASQLPNELLKACEELAMAQLMPDSEDTVVAPEENYEGPITLLKTAYDATESLGSTTALLAILDNSTQIHGKLHPMCAIVAVGDCELLILRRLHGRQSALEAVFHTEMQRIGGHAQQPMQIARIDERVDPDFDEDCAVEVIERGSAVHYVSAYEGDILVMGSDGVFDNMFLDEIIDIVNQDLRPQAYNPRGYVPADPNHLRHVAHRIVMESHAKTAPGPNGYYPEAPIGKGGKVDDTCCVVGEVVEWTQSHSEVWSRVRRNQQWENLFTCGGTLEKCSAKDNEIDQELMHFHGKAHNPRTQQRYEGVTKGGDDCTIL